MKSLQKILTIAILALVIVACKNEKQPKVINVETEVSKKAELDPNATYAKAEFTIKGMTCEMGCAKTIEKKLAKMDGVKSATVDFGKELAMVEFDEAKVNTENLVETVTKTGDTYSVEDMKTVDTFAAQKECKPDCKKACCADKKEKKECAPDCKKECCSEKAKTEKPKKKACKDDCKKDCCKKEGKA
ncbi:MAG: heavy-metal-associated domain-containing protein [Flavobacteriaceae bacterium]|nr:cation transporter [Bacteroidia bacterium]NNK83120.1 heavy-metal-associated domain-containing protein [Flavobacteriaceae bacterium]